MRRKHTPWLCIAATMLLISGCSDSLAPGEQLLGRWGIRIDEAGIGLLVRADSALLQMPCSAARFPGPIVLDESRSFTVAGEYMDWHGPQPAELTGVADGSALELVLTSPRHTEPLQVRVRRGVSPDFSGIVCLAGGAAT